MKSQYFAILAASLFSSCNLSVTPKPTGEEGIGSISPRLMLPQGQNLPVTDSVHIKVWSNTPSNVWYEKTLQWSAKFVVISGVPQGTNFLFSIEGRKLQSDGSSAIWWSGNQTGTTNSAQSLDPVDLPVWLSVGDTVAPTISGLKDTILDSAVTGVRLRWTVSDNSLASVWLGSNKLTLAGNVANDTLSIGVGGSTPITVKAFDNAGNLSIKSVTIARKSKGNTASILPAIPWNSAIAYDSVRDSRDGKIYRTVVIGTQKWIAENLNYSGTLSNTGTCYNNSVDSCAKYGRLYTWSEVMDGSSSSSSVPSGKRGVCPTGWHVPSIREWDTLEARVSKLAGVTSASVGKALKSSTGWNPATGNGTDLLGFRFLPGGANDPSLGYRSIKASGSAWSSTQSSSGSAYVRAVMQHIDSVYNNTDGETKNYGLSLRCVNDTATGLTLPIAKDSVLPQDANTIGLWNFNEGTGTTIKNMVTGKAGNLLGGYSWIDGYFGKAVKFDGISGYADLKFDPPESNVSFEMVVQIEKDTGWLFTLWGSYNSGIALKTNGFLSPEFMSIWSMSQPHLDQEIYLALIIDSNRMGKLYVNGFLAGSGLAIDSYSWSQTVLASYTGSAGFVKCTYEKFRISSVARSQSEISLTAQKIGLTTSLIK